jgi:hypothetical protein
VKKVSPEEILDLVAYEKVRPEYLERIIALKVPRRVFLGDRLTFVFENRDTVMFQVQEMTRAERTVDEAAIAHEVSVYNELIPETHGLSATLMIEITDGAEIRGELDRLIGIDEHVSLKIGDEVVRASFDEKQFEEDRISAVQFVRFPLGPELAKRFADPHVEVRLIVDHPNYRHEQALEGATRTSLAADLA